MSMTLYAAPMSSATPVVHALAELDVPYELESVDLSAGDQRKPAFLALNPNGQVPTLVVDGTPMFEALAILQWLGNRYGVDRGLWPAADDPKRLEALSWTTWAYATFGPNVRRLHLATSDRAPKELHSEAHAQHSREQMQQLLGVLDARLEGRRHLLGDDFSLADLVVASVVTYATYCGLSAADHPRVCAWLERFQARPAYRQTWAPSA